MAWRFLRSGIAFPLCVAMALASDAVAQSSGWPPLFDGMGSYSHPIRTSSPQAQRYFDQGLALLYNFNHAEAERSFLKAAELDPKAPMPWWGVGIALGLNYNRDVTKLEGERGKGAYDAAQKAVVLSRGGAPIGAALAAALGSPWVSTTTVTSQSWRASAARAPTTPRRRPWCSAAAARRSKRRSPTRWSCAT